MGSELLFLRGGDLVAFEMASGGLRTLAEDVRDFDASCDGATIALLRGAGLQSRGLDSGPRRQRPGPGHEQ